MLTFLLSYTESYICVSFKHMIEMAECGNFPFDEKHDTFHQFVAKIAN